MQTPESSVADRVHTLLLSCLYEQTPADTSEALRIEGVVLRFGFDPAAVARHRDAIQTLVDELVPDAFYEGMSFLMLCQDRKGRQWGEQRNADELLCLALAVGRAAYPISRDLWGVLPGGVPYVLFSKAPSPEKVDGCS